MPETDRVSESVTEFLASDYGENLEGLSNVVQHTVIDGYRRFMEMQTEDEELKQSFTDIQDAVLAVKDSPPATADLHGVFVDLLNRAMEARRATYDLTDPERPWEQLSPAAALASDDDMYAYSIVDTVVDKIEKLINPPDPTLEEPAPSPPSAAVLETLKKQEEEAAASRAESLAKLGDLAKDD